MGKELSVLRHSTPLPVHIVVAESNRMHVQVMADAFKRSAYRFFVEACEVDSKGALAAIRTKQPDVAVINADLQDGHSMGFKVARELHATHSVTQTVLVLDSSELELVSDAFRCGVRGVFCQESTFDALCKCVYVVAHGQLWASSIQLRYVMDAFSKAAPLRVTDWKGDHLLTKREDEVVHLISEGATTREICQRLNLTEHTVRNYVFRIYVKLGISSRVELVLYVLNQNRLGESPSTPDNESR